MLNSIGVNIILPLSDVNSRFLAPSRFSRFSPAFFKSILLKKKMRYMSSVQRQVELRRLGNQLPVLGKANSLCKIVKLCVFCLFVRPKLRLSRGLARAKSM